MGARDRLRTVREPVKRCSTADASEAFSYKMIHSDWLKLFTGLATANQCALFKSRVITLL